VWGVQPIAGDHLLVASDGNFVEEIDWVGKVLASRAVPQAVLDARRLPDGGMVAACWRGPCAVRYGADGKEQWRVKDVHATDIEPLASGNFLIAGFDDNLLLEVDADGHEVWRLPTKDGPMDVDPLPNGNLLVAFDRGKRVVELDRAGNELHTLQLPGSPQDAQRLRDGRTLVGIDHGAVMFGADGNPLWRFDGGQCGHVVARLAPIPAGK
jgi:hypothetical protein